jgi:hypothetical protein
MTMESQPTSEWEHSHALSEGDELTDTGEDTPLTVIAVHDDGGVSLRVWRDQRHGQEYYDIREDEDSIRTALTDGIFETTDGKSHELASF